MSSLIAVRPPVRPPVRLPVSPPVHPPVSPPRGEPLPVVPRRDFSDDEEEDQTGVGELLSKAINTIGGTTDVSYYLVVLRRHTMLKFDFIVGWFHIQVFHRFSVLIFIQCIISLQMCFNQFSLNLFTNSKWICLHLLQYRYLLSDFFT